MGELRQGEGIGVADDMVTIWIDTSTGRQALPILPVDELPLRTVHERRNLLPAILLAYQNGMLKEEIVSSISDIEGLPHRLQFVAEIEGVRYINDSAATMPEATVAALEAYAGETLVHILGGSDKKLEFEGLARMESKANIRALVFLPGTATERMRTVVRKAFVKEPLMVDVQSMAEAVRAARDVARRGDIVLLSPGATSFGLFQHEFDRGAQFIREVKKSAQ
jgi:UDP-N-acetylmuramoylalanine--D-glutamate ligase